MWEGRLCYGTSIESLCLHEKISSANYDISFEIELSHQRETKLLPTHKRVGTYAHMGHVYHHVSCLPWLTKQKKPCKFTTKKKRRFLMTEKEESVVLQEMSVKHFKNVWNLSVFLNSRDSHIMWPCHRRSGHAACIREAVTMTGNPRRGVSGRVGTRKFGIIYLLTLKCLINFSFSLSPISLHNGWAKKKKIPLVIQTYYLANQSRRY